MKVAMESVIDAGMLCEASICYSGDLTNPHRTKYDMDYYVGLAKELEKMGAHILAIKDMAGLCKPAAASALVKTLREEVGIPVHFHTHDTAGIQAASILEGAKVGLDIADGAMAPMSGGTSQPNLNTVVQMLRFSDRDTNLDGDAHLTKSLTSGDRLANSTRHSKARFFPQPETCTNMKCQVVSTPICSNRLEHLGLADRWAEVCKSLRGSQPRCSVTSRKVTPTSKAVGDMALFMVANDLTNEDVLNGERDIAFPASVLDLIGGGMGQPPGGFPQEVKDRVLLGKDEFKGRPGETLPPADFDAARAKVAKIWLNANHWNAKSCSGCYTNESSRTSQLTSLNTETSAFCRLPTSSTVWNLAKRLPSTSKKARR